MELLLSPASASSDTDTPSSEKKNGKSKRSNRTGHRIIKSLFIPGFAEAGSNDTFRPNTACHSFEEEGHSPPLKEASSLFSSSNLIPDGDSRDLKDVGTRSLMNESLTTISSVVGYNFLPETYGEEEKGDGTKINSVSLHEDGSCNNLDWDSDEIECQSDLSVMGSDAGSRMIDSGSTAIPWRRSGINTGGITEEMLKAHKEEEERRPAPIPEEASVEERAILTSVSTDEHDTGRNVTPPRRRGRGSSMFPMTTPPSAISHVSPVPSECDDETSHLAFPIFERPAMENNQHLLKSEGVGSNTLSPGMQSPSLGFLTPLRRARQCFSFDYVALPNADHNTSLQSQSWDGSAKKITQSQSQVWRTPSWATTPDRSPRASHSPRIHRHSSSSSIMQTDSNNSHHERQSSKFTPPPPIRPQLKPIDKNQTLLQSSQRIQIEREDAVDILSCLVQRSVTYQQHESNIPVQPSTSTHEIISLLKHLSQQHPPKSHKSTHDDRLLLLDRLLESHTYAMEMKRAALSASAWLKSIGRLHHPPAAESDAFTYSPSTAVGERCADVRDGPSESVLKDVLRTKEREILEKDDRLGKLDSELCKCRAEIGRLKSTARAEALFTSLNRSVLDGESSDEEDHNPHVPHNYGGGVKALEGDLPNVTDIQDEESEEVRKEILILKALLEKERRKNKWLENKHDPCKDESEEMKSVNLDTSLDAPEEKKETAQDADISIHDISLSKELDDYKSSISGKDKNQIQFLSDQLHDLQRKMSQQTPHKSSDQKVINVQMLDAENFVTEWDSQTDLPPPPDHDLRSPIVSTLLQQWTEDRSMQSSLISWIERLLNGEDPENLPTLRLNSLDHQIRDGFLMHVLPLLLQKSNLHLQVQTRAHRKTTYDIDVTVSKSKSKTPYTSPKHIMAFQASTGAFVENEDRPNLKKKHITEHSIGSAPTSPVSSRRHTEEESSLGSTLTPVTATQNTLLTAIGGAFGFGRKNRVPQSDHSSPPRYVHTQNPKYIPKLPTIPSSPMQEDQPFHRVVSAPPGRIGLTFVQYRGHAVVSDVSPKSPLKGWVFPSDILIAIDEVPVSGKRVRDIVKLLQARGERQRALRVISGHAMSEFTRGS